MPSAHRLGLRVRATTSVRNMLKSWHRLVGIFAAVFLLLLSSTGLLLMQTDALGLDSRYVDSDGLLNWYGIRPAPPATSFAVGSHWIIQLGRQLYFDTLSLQNIDGQLVGAVTTGDEIVVATSAMLVLLTKEGAIAEKLGAESKVPQNIEYLGVTPHGRISLKTANESFLFDAQTTELVRLNTQQPSSWSTPENPPSAISEELNRRFRGTGLSLERILLDLHTGRLLGAAGVALINLASLALLVLVISGVVLWWLRAREAKNEN
ncbi:MAG: putative membrane protein (Fun14 family) [Gammaproteobacteria bacterium]|jgi:uncharacterized membrane protein (Fun14 family)